MVTENGIVLKITASSPKEGMHAYIETEKTGKKIKSLKWRVKDIKKNIKVCGNEDVFKDNVSVCAVFEADMWSVKNPVLYNFEADIVFDDESTQVISDNFGFRYFNTDENYIYLNGYPFYMRAYIRGCSAHEHENNCKLEISEFYKKNIIMAKKYGFNTIRFHSVIPPRECFQAADELGILIHIETRAENSDYENLKEMLYGKNEFVTNEELDSIINSLYNHPSFMVYCVGNEIRMPGKKKRIKEIYEYIKKNDPTRLFIDTCAHGEYDRECVDFDVQHMGYYFPYGKNKNMFSDTNNLLGFGTVKEREMVSKSENGKIKRGIYISRPLIAHEVCHYTSWRDYYALKEKFKKYEIEAPWWVDESIKMLEAKGYKNNFRDYVQTTKDFQFKSWKTAFEGIRSSKLLAGFHMLQFADTDRYENSNGIVDCFDDEQGISAEEFCAFNSDTIIIAKLPKQVFEGDEKVQIPVIISQFAINPPSSGTFSYSIEGNNKKIYSSGILLDVDTGRSGIYEICSIEVCLPNIKKAEKLSLKCKMEFNDSTICNSWDLWLFPKKQEILKLPAQKDMKDNYLDFRYSFCENDLLVVTDKLDDSLFEKLENGKDVILIYRTDWTRHLLHKDMDAPEYSFRHTWDRYKAVIWDRGTFNGGFDEKNILNKYGFCTNGRIDYQYYSLIDDSDKINLDDFPVKVKSIVSGLDKSNRDRFDVGKFKMPDFRYDKTMRNFSYAFEMRVGNGRLLVTGFNFTKINENDIASSAMLETLVKYCKSEDFKPEAEMSCDELKNYLKEVAKSGPQKEGMMTQYWQLDNEPVESMDYWNESERYLREDMEKEKM